MIWTVAAVFCAVMVLEFLIAWIKALLDENMSLKDYRYCDGCKQGFCMEYPKTKGCVKWEKEHGEH